MLVIKLTRLMKNSARTPTHTHTWFHGGHDGAGRLEHGFVNGFLVRGELAVGWEGAGDVGGVAVIFSTHIEQTERNKT